ncbi:MAG: acyltransferase [Actinomycetota bacterium]|nr:acyltransferase [Actinomycetota bacterium]
MPAASAGAQRIPFLAGDAVRGIAMTCVIVLHLAGGSLVLTDLYSVNNFSSYGRVPGTAMYTLEFAVPMFFVLSGYLISGPWIRAYVLGRPTPSVRRYLRNRALRIVPVFWLLSAVMLAIYGTYGSSPLDVTAIFGFGQVYDKSGAQLFLGQAWSIDVEVAFYLLVPVVAILLIVATRRVSVVVGRDLSPRGRVVLVLSLVTVGAVASAWLRATHFGTLWTDAPVATLYSFAPGIALAALEIELAGPIARRRPRLLAPILGLCAVGLAVVVVVAASSDPIAMSRARGELAVVGVCGLAVAALLARQLVRGDSPRWVDNRVTRWLGARSYPCYILQSATIASSVAVIGRVSGVPWIELLALSAFVLPVTFAIGAVVHAAFERPVLAWGRGRGPRNGGGHRAQDPPAAVVGTPVKPVGAEPPSAASSAAPLGEPSPVQAS